MKIQFVNDLHIEFGHWPEIEKAGDVLCVAGDLCAWETRDAGVVWLNEQAERFEQVFFIPGNHEHYGNERYLAVREFWQLACTYNRGNIHYPRHGQEYNGYVFLGDTLWTDLDNKNPVAIMDYNYGMNDARWVYVTTYLNENKLHRERLETYILANIDKPIIMMTHHLPMMELVVPRWRGDRLNYCFANTGTWAFDMLVKYGNVKVWHFGHTHDTVDTTIEGCRFICNPYGYHGNVVNPAYKNDKVVEV